MGCETDRGNKTSIPEVGIDLVSLKPFTLFWTIVLTPVFIELNTFGLLELKVLINVPEGFKIPFQFI